MTIFIHTGEGRHDQTASKEQKSAGSDEIPFLSRGLQEKKDTTELQARSKEYKVQIEEAEAATKAAIKERDDAVGVIGNWVHDSVPISNDEVRSCSFKDWPFTVQAILISHVEDGHLTEHVTVI